MLIIFISMDSACQINPWPIERRKERKKERKKETHCSGARFLGWLTDGADAHGSDGGFHPGLWIVINYEDYF